MSMVIPVKFGAGRERVTGPIVLVPRVMPASMAPVRAIRVAGILGDILCSIIIVRNTPSASSVSFQTGMCSGLWAIVSKDSVFSLYPTIFGSCDITISMPTPVR